MVRGWSEAALKGFWQIQFRVNSRPEKQMSPWRQGRQAATWWVQRMRKERNPREHKRVVPVARAVGEFMSMCMSMVHGADVINSVYLKLETKWELENR